MKLKSWMKKLSGVVLFFDCAFLLTWHSVSAEGEDTAIPISAESTEESESLPPLEESAVQGEETPAPQETEDITSVSPSEEESAFPPDEELPTEMPQSLEGLVEDEDGNLFFYEQEQAVTNALKEIEGNYYYFKENGIAVKSSFVTYDGEQYYFQKDGTAAIGWKTVDGRTYYFAEDATMLTGLCKIDGEKYYFSLKTGKAFRGLKKINGKAYYFGKHYQAVTGWKKLDGVKYYFNNHGVRVSGWKKLDGETYYFQKNGIPASGLKKIEGEQYYFKKFGKMCTGLKKVDSALYYFRQSGKAWKNKRLTVDGNSYYFGSDGKATLNGWMNIGTTKYYADQKGALRYYWKQMKGTWHLCDINGKDVYVSNSLYQAWNKVQSMSSATSYLITVDTSACRVMIFQGSSGNWVPIKFWICSPGKSSTPTVKGIFTVGSRGHSFGSGFTCYYYTQFHGNYLFHSVLYYQGTLRQKDGRLGMKLSHGCVRLQIDNAKWIYSNIPRGTKVYTY